LSGDAADAWTSGPFLTTRGMSRHGAGGPRPPAEHPMKAVYQRKYGAPDEVLEVRQVDKPMPSAGEVLVRVRAASMHPDVWHMMHGRPYVLRIMGAGLLRPRNRIPGTDLAGVVEAVGGGVTRFKPGDEVFGESVRGHQWHNGGAFAEYVCTPETSLQRKPKNLSFEQAAAVPTSGYIALKGVRDEGGVKPDQRVLVNGAGGGVGTLAVQIAKGYGAEVTAVDTAAKHAMLRSIGADRVIDHEREDFTTADERYDLVIDVPGNHPLRAIRRVLADDGAYVLIGHDLFGRRGHRVIGTMGRFLKALVYSPFVSQRMALTAADDPKDHLATLKALIDDGRLVPVVDRTYSLDDVVEAIRFLETGDVKGKIVITM
jgi:NADPH:quinone reductase-like Zn-dependent oxidoreductase